MSSRTLWEARMRCILKPTCYPDKVLTYYCERHFTAVCLFPPIYGYVVPLQRLGFASERYCFVIYLKSPGCRHLIVSEELYASLEECSDKLKFYLRESPLFIRSSRFLF